MHRSNHRFERYYRFCKEELLEINNWLTAGKNAALIGTRAAGRGERSQLLLQGQQVCFVPVALHLAETTQTDSLLIYRTVLRSLHEQRARLPERLRTRIEILFEQYLLETDRFVVESMLRDFLLTFPDEPHVVFVTTGIDEACLAGEEEDEPCPQAVATVVRTLLSLQSPESSACYLFELRRSIVNYLDVSVRRSLHEAVGRYTQIVRGLTIDEAGQVLRAELEPDVATDEQVRRLAEFTGGMPALLTAVVEWWRDVYDLDERLWLDDLYEFPATQAVLRDLWSDLSFRERRVLSDLELVTKRQYERFAQEHRRMLVGLERRGLCVRGERFSLAGALLERHVRESRHTVRGPIWFNKRNDTFYQGEVPLESLSPRAEAALGVFYAIPV